MFCNIMKMQSSYVLAVLFFTTTRTCIKCYPIANTESEPKTTTPVKEEYTLPNGTVVGKYTYTDQEGNPVQVKYFADDSGYGVELKSVKVVDTSEPMHVGDHSKLDYSTNDLLPPLPTERESNTGASNLFPANEKPRVTNEFVKNLPQSHWSADKGFNFELPRNLPKSKKCTTTKVRVYYDELNRKGRAINPYKDGMPKVCEQF